MDDLIYTDEGRLSDDCNDRFSRCGSQGSKRTESVPLSEYYGSSVGMYSYCPRISFSLSTSFCTATVINLILLNWNVIWLCSPDKFDSTFSLFTAASSSGKKTSLCMLYLGYAWNRLTLFDLDYVQLKFLLYVSNLNKCLCLLLLLLLVVVVVEFIMVVIVVVEVVLSRS